MAYEIQFITDTRFKGTKNKLLSMDKKLKSSLSKLPCVSVKDISPVRELHWKDKTKQWRKSYIINKRCRDVTWNEVMTEINKIQAPYYKRV